MSQQIQITGGAKVRDLQDVIIGSSGVLSSLAFDVANGVPKLDSNGKILVSQLPNSVMEYKGTWDASTNTPTLADGTGNQGDVYLCNVAGTVDFGAGPIAFVVGDQVIYSGSIWQKASGSNGTVTSVAVTESGDSLNITGSPITTSGTINIGFNGTNLQYVNGAGNLTTFPTLTGYVPYTGATANVDLGAFDLTADLITGATGSFASSGGSDTFAINHSSGSGIALNITKGGNGEGLYINKTSGSGNAATIVGTLEATTLVKSGGTSSQFLKADGTVDSSTYALDSLVVHLAGTETITGAKTFSGYTTFTSTVDITSGLTFSNSGFTLLLQPPTLSVNRTVTLPNATGTLALTSDISYPVTSVFGRTGAVVATEGDYSLTQLSDVTITTPTNGQVLKYNGTAWVNNSDTDTGITTLNTLTALTQTFATGTSGTDFGISSATSTHTFNLPTASATNRGALSSADWTTFNSKQGTITLTTTGTSGTATFTSNTLNIPNYGSALSGYLPLTGGTLTGALSGTSATFSGVLKNTGDLIVSQGNVGTWTGKGLAMGYSVGADNGLLYSYDYTASVYKPIKIIGSTLTLQVTAIEALTIASTGAATFSSSVTATGLYINSTGAIYFNSGLALFPYGGHTYIRPYSASGNINFQNQAGSLLVTMLDSGNVGIGTASPASKLEIAGEGRIAYSKAVGGTYPLDDSGFSGLITTNTVNTTNSLSGIAMYVQSNYQAAAGIFAKRTGTDAADMVFYAGSNLATERMRITSGGNVGIGRTNPSTWLELNSTAVGGYFSEGLKINRGEGFTTQYGILNSYANSGFNLIAVLEGGGSGGTINFMRHNAGSGTPTSSMFINGTGNVGIGTSSPSYTLHAQATSANVAYFNRTTTDGDVLTLAVGGNNAFVFNTTSGVRNIQAPGAVDMALSTNNTERLRITSGGNVLIGTTTPNASYKLTLSGASSGVVAGLALVDTEAYSFSMYTGASALIFRDITNSSERMRITSGGNVLIGTTDDGGRLVSYSTTAATQIKAAGTAPAITFSNTITSPTIGGSLGACTSAGQFLSGTAAGDMILINQFSGKRLYAVSYSGGVYLSSGATSWTANSDIRLKNINSHIENAVEKLSTLQTINFSYKDDKTNKQNLGLIAQEVEKIFPELIDKNGDGMLGVRYTELVPVLIKAVQELKLEIETLKNK